MRERYGRIARYAVIAAACLTLYGATPVQQPSAGRPPNVILIYADDMGYADIGPFSTGSGAGRPVTPNLDRMAKEGVRLTSFYVAQAVCSASRAALLTGSYSNRVSINGALNHTADYGLNLERADDRRSAQAARLRDRHGRQMASGPQGAVPAAAPRLRRVPRTALLERHVAAAPAAEELLPRPAADGRRPASSSSTPINHS